MSDGMIHRSEAHAMVAHAYQAAADLIGRPDIDLEDVIGTQKAILALTPDDAREAEADVIRAAVAAAQPKSRRRTMSDDLVKRLMNRRDYEGLALNPDGPEAVARILALGAELLKADARIKELEAKLAMAMAALEGVRTFVRDLAPYADQGHTLVPALEKACLTLAELTGDKK